MATAKETINPPGIFLSSDGKTAIGPNGEERPEYKPVMGKTEEGAEVCLGFQETGKAKPE